MPTGDAAGLTPRRRSRADVPIHLALEAAPSHDGDESFISDITGDVMMQATPPRKTGATRARPAPPAGGGTVLKATSLLSGAANIYQSLVGAAQSVGEDDEDDDEVEDSSRDGGALGPSPFRQQPVSDPDGHTFVTAVQSSSAPVRLVLPDRDCDGDDRSDDTENRSARLLRLGSSRRGFDFLRDAPTDMTYSRRIALQLMRHGWYYPRSVAAASDGARELEDMTETAQNGARAQARALDDAKEAALRMEAYPFGITKEEFPSLEKAWAYFEHVALPRHLVEPKADLGISKNIGVRAFRKLFLKGNKQLSRAEPGERNLPTKLYDPVFTPHKQMGDFGLGIGLYFSTLRAITILTLLAGLLNVANVVYFRSPEYSNGQSVIKQHLVRGSAICTRTEWVVCSDCSEENTPLNRLAYGTNELSGQTLTLALRNMCDATTLQQGFVNYATLFLVIIGIFCLNMYLQRMEVSYDEDEQTAQDYSIVITNPPCDAKDPSEWKDFFHEAVGAHVTTCTIAVDNDLLVRTLVERREVLRKIEMAVEPGTSLDKLTLTRMAAKVEHERTFTQRLLGTVAPGIPEHVARLVVLTAKIQGLAQQDYPVTNVFISFETEADQRKVLSEMKLGSLDVSRNQLTALKRPEFAFRGNQVLSVEEADEPNTIRWQDLNETFMARLKQQFMTLLATIVAIIVIAVIIALINNTESAAASAFAISISNAIFPMFAKILNNSESHSSEGGRQRSLYCKIALFRWVNTAIVLTIITPFTSTISYRDGLIGKVYALFFAEIVTTNMILLADPIGHVKRHLLAPRAKSQDAMNLNFRGTEMDMAERYTNMTKILFLALWYCAIYPAALFLCSLTLFIVYFADKFAIMRIWKRQPHLGTTISEVSRGYFFSLAIVAMAIVSSYYWSAFPFDNLCESGNQIDDNSTGNVTVTLADRNKTLNSITLEADDTFYHHCNQDFIRYGKWSFPFIPRFQSPGAEWMTPEQEQITAVYGWTAVGVVGFVLLQFLWRAFRVVKTLFKSPYKPVGDDQGINFSEVPSISTYVPQVESSIYSYPLLACSVDHIDPDLLEWTDPDRPHSFYDLTKDAEVLLQGMDVSAHTVFSQIAHFPPDKAIAE